MFDALASIFCENTAAYHYEMFASADSMKEVVARLEDTSEARLVYLASHGSELALAGPGKNTISRTVVRNAFSTHRFDGVYFGSCEFMNVKNAQFFLLESEWISPWWFAGFSKSVPWITSTVFDVMFFDIYYNVKRKQRSIEELDLIKKVAKITKEKLKGLCDELGFDVYVMEAIRGPRGQITSQRRKLDGLISGGSWNNY